MKKYDIELYFQANRGDNMESFSQITFQELNSIFKSEKVFFKRIDFERGLGIIDDYFIITFGNDKKTFAINIITNLRFINKDGVYLRYYDLFLKENCKKISKKEYLSQTRIGKTLLNREIIYLNKKLFNRLIKRVCFDKNGDLVISFNGSYFSCADDYDARENGRQLYEILFKEGNTNKGFKIFEKDNEICVFSTNKVEIFPRENKEEIAFYIPIYLD